MSLALLLSRLLLAGVLIVAGIAKLADLHGSRQAMGDFGVPSLLATPLGTLLPVAELAVAMALVPRVSAWWGAVGALILVLLFIAGIVFNLARGRAPDCHCFGQLHSEPIGWSTLARNAILVGIAAFVLWQGRTDPGLSAVAWIGALTIGERVGLVLAVLVFAVMTVQGWLLYHVLRRYGSLLLRVEALETSSSGTAGSGESVRAASSPPVGLAVGTAAPSFRLSGLSDETLTLEALRTPGKPIVLLFVDPGCGPCTALLPEVGRWQREYTGKLTVALISRGTVEANRHKTAEHGVTPILLQRDREVAQDYQANGTPSAVIVRANGTIGSPLAQGADAIRALVAGAIGLPVLGTLPAAAVNGNGLRGGNVLATAQTSTGLKVGEPAPALSLPDLNGKIVNLADFRGKRTLVLFWNPGCGFCQRMLNDLKAWETSLPPSAPTLLVVSTGDVEANWALGLHAPVLLEPSFSTGQAFGARGTPSAVLIDAEGRIVSEVAVGAPAVLALAGGVSDLV